MTTRFLSLIAAFGFLAGAAPAWAQSPAPATLTTLDVRQLVARAQPADHARLAQHFTALAEKYAAESQRHESMGRGPGAHPGRIGREHVDIHCKRLVVLNAHLELTARALGAYHQHSGVGQAPARPADPVGFSSGFGARTPTAEELEAFRVSVGEADDHRALADYLTVLATRYDAQVAAHTAMASAYRGTRLAGAAAHCDRLVNLARDAAREARAAAQLHTRLGAGTE